MKDLIKCYCGHTTTCDCGPQQERSYSEEEVKDIMDKTWIKCVGNDGNNFKKIRDEILKQFKL